MAKRDFLTLLDCSPAELGALTERAAELKRTHLAGENHRSLAGRTGALILQVSSTRTRVAFEAGMAQLGGQAIFLSPADTQLGRGEPISDTARVLSQMVDVAMIRILSHDDLETFAAAADIPVINAMTARYHPCQLLADVQTFEELRGPIGGRRVAFIGDGYNMCSSYINAARQWGFELRLACPPGHEPPASALATGNAHLFETPQEAVEGAHLVVTDVWSSIGHEEEQAQRRERFAPYQVSEALLDGAADGTLFLHCLPAHRGEEVNATVLDDPRSGAWVAAGNRLHSQKALLEFLLLDHSS
ncbi:MAG: ornithine carbamoyltransferase [Gammaproteobacteria bacterium]|nr:ornithine carbamoyltransferase [Gammaproteobacteria bacterium]MYG12294.1 ornithine carbamoyltransferase [Gammaproteobacteria bacterium]MYK27061.1 ornithine carbamoyltransferase [Gammaproteobacteria bacterium]